MTRTQQSELYAAQHRDGVDLGSRFSTGTEAQTYVDSIVNSPWWEEANPRVRFVDLIGLSAAESRDGKSVGCFRPETQSGLIEMAAESLVENIVLHELAHVTAGAKYDSRSHDPAFAREYLELVFRVRGHEPWVQLRQAFIDGGVEF